MQAAASSAQTLRNALRSSPWIVIAIGIHAVLFAVLSLVYVVQHRAPVVSEIPSIRIHAPPAFEPIEDAPAEPFLRTVIPPNLNGVLVSPDDFAFIVDVAPVEPTEATDLTLPPGDPDMPDFTSGSKGGSSAIGPGKKPGHIGMRPSAFGGTGTGGDGRHGPPPVDTPRITEDAVLQGLRWLIRHQAPDGSWSAATLADQCTAGRACTDEAHDYSPQYDPGLTALALLAFLGHGIDGSSTQRIKIVDDVRGKAHVANRNVSDGLKWLLDAQGPDGAFTDHAGSLYNEALGALALSEAWGLSGERLLKEPAERMINYLVRAQKASPMGTGRWGWRYTPGGDSVADTSVTGWVVMALKSAEMTGLAVPRDAFDGALDFVHWATGPDGLVGYLDPAGAGQPVTGRGDEFDYHVGTMSALGMLVRTFAAHDITDPFLELGAQRLVADLPAVSEDGLSIDYYYWYYGSLALNQFDGPDSPRAGRGKYWDAWNEKMVAALLALQDKDKAERACSRGGWLTRDRWSHAGGPVYSTAINVLTLEVYYRYENAFGRMPPPPRPGK